MLFINLQRNLYTDPMKELFEAIEGNFNELAENNGLTTKASQQRARKAAGEIKKLITDYRKASVLEQ